MAQKKKTPTTMQEVLAARTRKADDKRHADNDEIVRISARVRREDWRKMMDLRAEEGLSHQDQIIFGLGLLFEHFGMKPTKAP